MQRSFGRLEKVSKPERRPDEASRIVCDPIGLTELAFGFVATSAVELEHLEVAL